MFVFEILIYLVFALVMYGFINKTYLLNGCAENKKADMYLWLFWLTFAIVAGARWNVGADSLGYARSFDRGIVSLNKHEPLWDFLVLSVHNLGLHYSVGMAITAFVQIYFMTKVASKYRYSILYIPFVLFGNEIFFVSYCNGVRQMMAACIFVFASRYIFEKKLMNYAFWVFVAYQIHHSAIVIAPLYLLAYIRPEKISISGKRSMCVGIFLFCVIFGRIPQFQRLAGLFSSVVDQFGDSYTYVGKVVEQNVVGAESNMMSFGPAMASNMLISLFPIAFGKELKKAFKDKIPYFDLWWLFMFIYSCGYFLFINVHFMLVRPFNYFVPFLGLMLSLLLYYFHSKKKTKMFFILLISLWVGISWDIIKALSTSAHFDVITYKAFWMHSLY